MCHFLDITTYWPKLLLQPFYGSLDFVLDYLGEPVPETHTHNRFTALWNLSGTTRVSRYQKTHSPTTLKQETVSAIGISWAICKSALRSSQITMPAPHYSVFYRPDAFLPPNQQHQRGVGGLVGNVLAFNARGPGFESGIRARHSV